MMVRKRKARRKRRKRRKIVGFDELMLHTVEVAMLSTAAVGVVGVVAKTVKEVT